MSMLLANYLEPRYHNMLVLPFCLSVLFAHYQFPSSTFIVQHCAPTYSVRPDSQLMTLVVASALVQSHHQSIQNCLFLCSLTILSFCHLLLYITIRFFLLQFCGHCLPLVSLPLPSSSTQMLQFSLSNHCHVHLVNHCHRLAKET